MTLSDVLAAIKDFVLPPEEDVNHIIFAAAVALWWFAENLMDLAPYSRSCRASKSPDLISFPP